MKDLAAAFHDEMAFSHLDILTTLLEVTMHIFLAPSVFAAAHALLQQAPILTYVRVKHAVG